MLDVGVGGGGCFADVGLPSHSEDLLFFNTTMCCVEGLLVGGIGLGRSIMCSCDHDLEPATSTVGLGA